MVSVLARPNGVLGQVNPRRRAGRLLVPDGERKKGTRFSVCLPHGSVSYPKKETSLILDVRNIIGESEAFKICTERGFFRTGDWA